jgi:hypothetical protein
LSRDLHAVGHGDRCHDGPQRGGEYKFIGATFAALALFLIGLATRLSTEPVKVGSLPQLPISIVR